mmetsp:Transcript_31081/g.46868  ORF Transcript_31081/g.46868 Transcript_31081/m.46868 type:complete len:331 (+) Transcript_31081:56-1048(+)
MMYLTTAARTLLARAPARSASSIASRHGSLISRSVSSAVANGGSSSFPSSVSVASNNHSATSLRSMSTMDKMETGTPLYMSLYPEGSTDGGIRLGNIVPDFAMDTTHGSFDSFHEWKKGKWAILFSHPADFTPVCTTEIGRLALKYDDLEAMDCKVATLSVDPVKSHKDWLKDVVAHCENEIDIKFPIIGDQDRSISIAYGMIDPGNLDEQELPLTIRAVFIINPENKLMLSLNYPACVGRNMDEIVRCVEALQLSYEKSIATPANWPNNHADIPMPDGSRSTEFKGSVFLLPTVSEEEAKEHYPGYHSCSVPSNINYLRLVKKDDVEKK